MFSLTSQTALVTGASRGIGKAIALQLAKQGAWVAGTATSSERALLFSQTLRELHLKGQGLVLDVTRLHSIQKCFKELKKIDKLPDILVNNAGIVRDGLVLRLSQANWKAVLDVNLTGAFYIIQQCLPSMLKAHYGRIINIGSAVGLWSNIGQANYAAAKAGLIGFSKTVAREVAAKGITVNIVAPGLITTDMTKHLSSENVTQLLKHIPMSRAGTPDDIAYACTFLASKESGYITGHTLHINGGLWME